MFINNKHPTFRKCNALGAFKMNFTVNQNNIFLLLMAISLSIGLGKTDWSEVFTCKISKLIFHSNSTTSYSMSTTSFMSGTGGNYKP